MAIDIDKDTVLYVAKLAHLEIEERDVERFASQMSEILEYIEQLKEVDTEDVKDKLKSIHEGNLRLRDDVSHNSFDRETVLKLAPEVEDIFVKVPPVV